MKKLLSIIFLLIAVNLQAQISVQYVGKARQTALIFEGNSLMNAAVNTGPFGGTEYGHYIPSSVYNSVRSTSHVLTYTSYAISGRTQTQINASVSTNITPYVKRGDIIVVWEGTNDMYANGLSGADAYANLLTYAQAVRAYGCKIVVCTVIARDYALDAGDLMTRIGDYNTLVRNNSASFDGVCDLAADSHFDARADCANTTYYSADKIHLVTTGQNLVITLISAAVTLIY